MDSTEMQNKFYFLLKSNKESRGKYLIMQE